MSDAISKKILDVTIALSSEKDDEVLLELILEAAMDITNCDAGTLYIKKDNHLHFKIMITRSMGGRVSPEGLPPVDIASNNLCARALIDERIINIPDVLVANPQRNAGSKKYDEMTGYKTETMLVVPMVDKENNQIGVLQLINALDADGHSVRFSGDQEIYVSALTSLAATSLVKMEQAQEISGLLDSLVRVLSTAIYERTPYNVTHTQNMVKYAKGFIAWLNANHPHLGFSKEDKRQFIMSVWLHDVGKLTVPLEVMNKDSRLGDAAERVFTRLEIIELTARLNEATNGVPFAPVMEKLTRARELIKRANSLGRLADGMAEEIKEIARLTYVDASGEVKNWLTPDETTSLCIVSGTLTDHEREIMKSHVVMTDRILKQVSFGSKYMMVAKWASEHHEFLNGTGYPKQLKNGELDKETRILTILDVFDGLSAKDRPYKPAMPLEKVQRIMNEMADEGKLDRDLLNLFIQSKVWEIEADGN